MTTMKRTGFRSGCSPKEAALTREEVIEKLQDIDGLLSGDDDDSDDDEDADDGDDDLG